MALNKNALHLAYFVERDSGYSVVIAHRTHKFEVYIVIYIGYDSQQRPTWSALSKPAIITGSANWYQLRLYRSVDPRLQIELYRSNYGA